MKELLEICLREVGRIQKERFKKVHNIEIKESISSIVTEVDILCETIILEIIRKEYPSHNILAEESGIRKNNSKYTWVIDPLDGTSNFAAGLPWFGVLIAVLRNDKPILGGAYLPMDDKLYIAESGKGAFLNGEVLTIRNSKLNEVLCAFSTDYSNDLEFLEKGVDLYRFLIKNSRNIRSTNCLLDFMMVAEGKFGAVINMYTKIWDIAAPFLIINEAGGQMKDINFRNLSFELSDKSIQKNYPVIAGSIAIFDELKKAGKKF